MQIEFLKVHTDKSGRSFKISQITDMDPAKAQELIKQGIAKERAAKPGEKPPAEKPPTRAKSGLRRRDAEGAENAESASKHLKTERKRHPS